MDNQRERYRHILFFFFYFWKGKNAVQTRKELYDFYCEDCFTECQCKRWFAWNGFLHFNGQVAPLIGRSTTTEDNKIKASIEANRRKITQQIAENLVKSNSFVYMHLQHNSYVNNLGVWVPHGLKEIHLIERINICDFLLNRN